MEIEAFGKTFTLGKKPKTEPKTEPKTPEDIQTEAANFEFIADIATINAIPEEITRKYRVQGVLKQQGLIITAVIALFALIWVGSAAFLSFQEGTVTSLNKERDLLQQESDALSPYQEYKQALTNKRTVLSESTNTDINYGQMYQAIIETANASGIAISDITAIQFGEDGETGACVSPDPLNQTSNMIGCVAISAKTPNDTQLIQFLRGLEDNTTVEGGFILPSVASFSNGEGRNQDVEATTVNMSVFFTSKFYSNKYSDLLSPIEEMIAGKKPVIDDEEVEESDRLAFDPAIIAEAVLDELVIEDNADNIDIMTAVTVEICETGEVSTTQNQIDGLASSVNIESSQIITAVREKC